MKTKNETNEIVLSAINYVCNVGNMPIYNQILKNYNKGYKPAKDFVKKVVEKIDSKEICTNIDLINYLSNIKLTELIPHTYSRYK